MIKYSFYQQGPIFGIQYEMDGGRRLPMHSHDAWDAHNVTVLKGAVLFDGDGIRKVLVPGTVFEFDNSKSHEITAIAGGATILNIFKNGIPEQYKNLPASEHSGQF